MARRAVLLIVWGLLIVWVLATTGAVAAEVNKLQLVDDFEDIQNQLGGYRNPFQRAPSTVQASRVADQFHGPRGRSTRIAGHRAQAGFCGYWLHFFDFKADVRAYFDSRPFRYLSFWVKGAVGNESFLVKLADRQWIEKEDALAVGPVEAFLPGGVTTRWREVLIPLDQVSKLDRRELGGLTIEFTQPGDHVIYLDDVSFKTSLSAQPGLPRNVPAASAGSPPSRKLWVWKSETLLQNKTAGDSLLDFCSRHGIDEVWMQLLYKVISAGESEGPTELRVELRHSAALRDFLRRAHARRIRVHALDGAPHYSQRAHHEIPLAVVDALLAFNQDAPTAERFDGVHFDNEPYLLVGWVDPAIRQEILLEFLELNAECQRRVKAKSQMKFGIDIPFWWQARDERTGQAVGIVEFHGQRKAASYHCLDMLDNVGVMNYRDTADGADGMIAHGRDLLAYADQSKRASVLMGVETFRSKPTPVYFVLGLPREEFFLALREAAKPLVRVYTLYGFRLQVIDDGTNIHVGIELPAGSLPARSRDVRRALSQLAAQTGLGRDAASAAAASETAVADFVAKSSEWSGFQPMQISGVGAEDRFAGFRVTRNMQSKTTFADNPPTQFAHEVDSAESYFLRYASFGGMAIHYYETVRELLEE